VTGWWTLSVPPYGLVKLLDSSSASCLVPKPPFGRLSVPFISAIAYLHTSPENLVATASAGNLSEHCYPRDFPSVRIIILLEVLCFPPRQEILPSVLNRLSVFFPSPVSSLPSAPSRSMTDLPSDRLSRMPSVPFLAVPSTHHVRLLLQVFYPPGPTAWSQALFLAFMRFDSSTPTNQAFSPPFPYTESP